MDVSNGSLRGAEGLVEADSINQQPSAPRRRRCCNCKRRYLCCGGFTLTALVVVLICWGLGLFESSFNRDFDVGLAVTFAKLAGAAYCDEKTLVDWDCGEKCISGVSKPVKVCQGSTTQVLITSFNGRGLVSFEGTKSTLSMFQDLRTWSESTPWEDCNGCEVHSGFLAEWLSLKYCIMDSLNVVGHGRGSSISIMGHSLGAAVATLGTIGLLNQGWTVREFYNYGMPRAGNEQLAEEVESRLKDAALYRITHHMDPIPHVPMEAIGFKHFGHEVFFDTSDNSKFVLCPKAEDQHCAAQYSNLIYDALNVNDHLDYMGVHTGSANCKGSLYPGSVSFKVEEGLSGEPLRQRQQQEQQQLLQKQLDQPEIHRQPSLPATLQVQNRTEPLVI